LTGAAAFPSAGSGSGLSGTDFARGMNVTVQRRAQFVGVLVRQIDLVLAAVEGKTDRLASAVDYLGVVQIVDESNNRTLRH
jgi:hypothetical protein